MKAFQVILGALCAVANFSVDAAGTGSVVSLTLDTFDKHVGKEAGALVKFYAPWCGHCKNMAAGYEKLAKDFEGDSSVVVAEVNCDEYKDLCTRFKVRGFPTLLWFGKGEDGPEEEYSGGRDPKSLGAYILKKNGPSTPPAAPLSQHVTEISGLEFESKLQDLRRVGKTVIAYFYSGVCSGCAELDPIFSSLAAAFSAESHVEFVRFRADDDKSVVKRYGLAEYPRLAAFPAVGPQPVVVYDDKLDASTLTAFVNAAAGCARSPYGGLGPNAGRIAALDTVAAEFARAAPGSDARTALLAVAAAAIADRAAGRPRLPALYDGAYYHTVMTRAAADPKFVASESARVKRLLESKTVARAKFDEFNIRLNILSVFSGDAKPLSHFARPTLADFKLVDATGKKIYLGPATEKPASPKKDSKDEL